MMWLCISLARVQPCAFFSRNPLYSFWFMRYPNQIKITLKKPDSKKKMRAKKKKIWMKRKRKERPIPGYSQAAMFSIHDAQYPLSRPQISAEDRDFQLNQPFSCWLYLRKHEDIFSFSIRTNAGFPLFGPLRTNFGEIEIKFDFLEINLQMP